MQIEVDDTLKMIPSSKTFVPPLKALESSKTFLPPSMLTVHVYRRSLADNGLFRSANIYPK